MFQHLEQSKKERILNAAFEEFSLYSYKDASTNRIVKKAGIAKGMLFAYFNNKKELFNDLIFIAVHYIKEHYFSMLDDDTNDFIEKYHKLAITKMKAYQETPYIFSFLANIYVNLPKNELSEDARQEVLHLKEQGFQKFHANINKSRFRKDISPETISRLILWIMAGYEKEITAKLYAKNVLQVDILPYWDEFYQFLDELKIIFYEGE